MVYAMLELLRALKKYMGLKLTEEHLNCVFRNGIPIPALWNKEERL